MKYRTSKKNERFPTPIKRGDTIMQNNKYEKQFKNEMEELAKKHERSIVYVDFMDYYIYQNSESPDRTLPHGYKQNELQIFQNAYNNFRKLMQTLIDEHGWYDYLGEYYEEYILASSKASQKGQFYTPRNISKLLSELVGIDVTPGEAYDPACGSARNLLDYHSRNPTTRLVGEDVDESACKMAVINFHLHHVNGVVNWIDALTREYMGTSWKILGDQIYITDIETIRANEDILTAISILSLNDDILIELCNKLSEEINKTLPEKTQHTQEKTQHNKKYIQDADMETPHQKGLDQWMK